MPPHPKDPPPPSSERVEALSSQVPPATFPELRPFFPAFRTDKGRVSDVAEGRAEPRISRAIMANAVLPKDFEAVVDHAPEVIENELFHSIYRVRNYSFVCLIRLCFPY